MTPAVRAALQQLHRTFRAFASPATYQRPGGAPITLPAFAAGLRGAQLIASAGQSTANVVVRRADLAAAALWPPLTKDRITLGSTRYAVNDWHPAPASGEAVFAKLEVSGT